MPPADGETTITVARSIDIEVGDRLVVVRPRYKWFLVASHVAAFALGWLL